jgi:hypothetical protein
MIVSPTKAEDIRSQMASVAKAHGLGVDTSEAGLVGMSFRDGLAVKSLNGGYEIEGLATTDDVDCEDEVIVADGLDWKVFETYRTIYCEHEYGIRNAVATLRSVTRVRGVRNGWLMRARLMSTTLFEDAARVLELAQNGALGFSVGVVPMDRGAPSPDEKRLYPKANSIIRKAQVFEVSATAMPCNLACGGVRVMADEAKFAKLSNLVTKGMAWAAPIVDRYKPTPRTVIVLD